MSAHFCFFLSLVLISRPLFFVFYFVLLSLLLILSLFIDICITFYLSVRAIMPVRHKLFLFTDGRVEKAGQLTPQSSLKGISSGPLGDAVVVFY